MNDYEKRASAELNSWQGKIAKGPSIADNVAKQLQYKMNSLIPERIHKVITDVIKNMVKVVLFGSELVTRTPQTFSSLEMCEQAVRKKIKTYKRAGAASGAWTGHGGILLGLADFPILVSMKFKFLFDVAAIYGFDVSDYRERLYILYIFQLAFSRKEKSREIYYHILDWDKHSRTLPRDMDAFDWRTLQQEYRDYIDLAKMLQLIPVIGTVFGAYANYKLINKLGETAMFAYRLRIFSK